MTLECIGGFDPLQDAIDDGVRLSRLVRRSIEAEGPGGSARKPLS